MFIDEQKVESEVENDGIVDEDQSWIANEDQQEVKHHQKDIEQVQQNSMHARNDCKIDTSPIPALVSLPAPELSPNYPAELDMLLAPCSA